MSKRESYLGSDQEARDERACDRIVNRTANRISREMDQMCADLPDMVAPQRALEEVVRKSAEQQRWSMQLIMEDRNIRRRSHK